MIEPTTLDDKHQFSLKLYVIYGVLWSDDLDKERMNFFLFASPDKDIDLPLHPDLNCGNDRH
ncbi:hypothetical protein J6590_100270, partial [Homalodisca vitripennis]